MPQVMKEQQQQEEDKPPLHELVRAADGVTLPQPIEIDGVKVILTVECLSSAAKHYATHIYVSLCLASQDGFRLFSTHEENERLEPFLETLVNYWSWWEGGLYRKDVRDRQLAVCRKLTKVMGLESDNACYVCLDYADHRTECGHAVCTRCYYKSFTDGGTAFKCGVCRRKYYTEDGEDLVEE